MQKKYIIALLGILAGSILGAACAAATAKTATRQPNTIPFTDCQLSAPGIPIRIPAKCGTYSVLENPADPNGPEINLKIAVLSAVSRNPAPDPIFFIPGGPGEAATESYLAVSSAFENLRQKRDIILVDQRGTGGSNPLECTSGEDEAFSFEDDSKSVQAALEACLSTLSGNPRFYTTAIAMDDLDQVREALGYPTINIYGASYGTRAALAYMRQHPDKVRSVVLDGVAPPSWSLGPQSAAIAQQAIESIFARCAAQADCSAAFPNLNDQFIQMMKQLQQEKIEVELPHPVTGEHTRLTLTPELASNTIHMLTYTPETVALLPLLIQNAVERQDWTMLAAQILSTMSTVSDSISAGMRFSVMCAEDVPFYPTNPESSGYLGTLATDTFQEICQTWPKGEIPADFKDPVESNALVLILSGEADPATPPQNGEIAAQTLPNSLHLIAPGQGHINVYRGCIPHLVTDFIEQGSADYLDTACVQKIEPVPFFINFSGPKP